MLFIQAVGERRKWSGLPDHSPNFLIESRRTCTLINSPIEKSSAPLQRETKQHNTFHAIKSRCPRIMFLVFKLCSDQPDIGGRRAGMNWPRLVGQKGNLFVRTAARR